MTGFHCVCTAEEAPPSFYKSREFLVLPFLRFWFHWWERALSVLGHLWHQQSHLFLCFQGANATGDSRNILYRVWRRSQSQHTHKGKLQQKMVNNMLCCVLGFFSPSFYINYFETLATPAVYCRESTANYQTTDFVCPFCGYKLV